VLVPLCELLGFRVKSMGLQVWARTAPVGLWTAKLGFGQIKPGNMLDIPGLGQPRWGVGQPKCSLGKSARVGGVSTWFHHCQFVVPARCVFQVCSCSVAEVPLSSPCVDVGASDHVRWFGATCRRQQVGPNVSSRMCQTPFLKQQPN
jgi:hypothetical protein